MRKKEKYSLTSAQRKQQRKDQLKNERKGLPQSELSAEEIAEAEVENAKRKQKRSVVIRLTALIMAVVLAVSAIVTGIVLAVLNRKQDVDNTKENPIATITLTGGIQIEIELLYKESIVYNDDGTVKTDARAAVANFIYLAEKGFFDNTVFSNIAEGFVAFEGYTNEWDDNFGWYKHKGKNETFMTTLGGFSGKSTKVNIRSNVWNATDFKLGYRIKHQRVIELPAAKSKAGYLAFITGTGSGYSVVGGTRTRFDRGSSTGFIMTYEDSPNFVMGEELKEKENMAFIGEMRMKQSAIGALKALSQRERERNNKISDWWYMKDNPVMIESIRITNLNSKLRENILNHFEDFVLWGDSEMEGAMKGYSSWGTTAIGYNNLK